MTFEEVEIKLEELKKENLNLWKQTHIMFIPVMNKILRETPIGEEVRVRYDVDQVWNEFVFLENKVLFFINKFLKSFLDGLKLNKEFFDKTNIQFSSNEIIEEAIYYFESIIVCFGVIIEPSQKDVLKKYLDNECLDKVFPNRNTIGIYWQIYLLRNRIAHFTENRYDCSGDECIQYSEISSRARWIKINDNGDIHCESTLIDLYKCIQARAAVKKVLEDGKGNPFDLLFPNKSAKGHGKKKPFLSYIGNDMYFDYVDSGIKLIKEIHYLLGTINKLFLERLMEGEFDKEKTLNTKTIINFENNSIEYSIKDVFLKS